MRVERIFVFAFVIFSFSLAFSQEQENVADEIDSAAEEIDALAENTEEGEFDSEEEVVVPEEIPPEEKFQLFKASSERIRMLEGEQDIFSAAFSQNHVLTNIANGLLQRRFYDEDFRLKKIEYWHIASSSAQSKMERILNYTFRDDGKLRSVRESNFDDQIESLTFFNANGKVRSQRKNQMAEGELVSFEIFTYEYDSKDRILQEQRLLYKVKNKKQIRVLAQKTLNKYSGENLLETSFYENSLLRLRTVYESDDTYVQTAYFDGGFTVRDFYENGVKVSTSYSNKNKKVRK